eukprot:8109313-Alexandrium_andersonii.AAC.1
MTESPGRYGRYRAAEAPWGILATTRRLAPSNGRERSGSATWAPLRGTPTSLCESIFAHGTTPLGKGCMSVDR